MIPSPKVFLQLGHIGSGLSLSFEAVGVDDDDDAGVALEFKVNFTGISALRLSNNHRQSHKTQSQVQAQHT